MLCDIIIRHLYALCPDFQGHLVHREVKNMVKYEVLFIINAELEDDKKNAVIEMAKETISADGEVENVDVWGNKKLAYPIQKKNEGFYVLITFKANPDLPKELDRKLRISDDVLRYIIVNKEEK